MIGAPVIAIVAGIIIAAVRTPSRRLHPGVRFASSTVLQGSIVVLGFNLSIRQVLLTGVASLPVLVGTLAIALGAAWVAGRLLGVGPDARTLIGAGTAICGASAIAAVDAVIGAADADVAYAVSTIFTFNVVAVLLYPALGHLMGLSQHAFGLWAGTAINDTSSVVAASTIYGHAAASYGVVVKLTRTLAIVPICLWLASRGDRRGAGAGGRPLLRKVFPRFVLGFVAAAIVNSVGWVPASWHHGLADLASWLITAALAGIGLSTRVRDIRAAGPRPLLLGAVLWATVGVSSLALQAATGTL